MKIITSLLLALAVAYTIAIAALHRPIEQWDWQDIDLEQAPTVPKDFLWGVASASFQVEGHHDASDNWGWWETQTKPDGTPRVLAPSGSGNDEWNLYPKDIENMKFLGVNSYRFSVSWSKIMPTENTFSEDALAHYDTLIDDLIAAGITPMVTLHHFSHPMWFERKGAFDKEANIPYFVTFAKKVFERYGDRVRFFATFNEPAVYGYGRHVDGNHPNPYNDANFQRLGLMLKHTLMAHDQVYAAIKQLPNGNNAHVGIVKSMMQMDPYSKYDLGDQIIAHYAQKLFADAYVRYFSQGVFDFQAFPVEADVLYKNPTPDAIKLDFIGLNYYSHNAFDFSYTELDLDKAAKPLIYPGEVPTDMDYGYYPEGLYRAIKDISAINKPIYITENGIGLGPKREALRQEHLKTAMYDLNKAIREGMDVRGYYYWSLNDNFEWDFAYSREFGLYSVDRKGATPERTPKKTALLYKKMIEGSRQVH